MITERLFSASTNKLSHILPDRVKRLILLASLSGFICNKKVFTQETIRKLNSVMELGSNEGALIFSMQFSKVIWKNKIGESILYPEQTTPTMCIYSNDNVIKQYTDKIPSWLKYADYQDMFNDIKKLFENKSVLV
jgi:hypothetical protein